MNRVRLFACLGLLLAVFGSCAPKPEVPAPVPALDPDRMHRAITLNDNGDTGTALALLLEGTESDATHVGPLPCLLLSEAEFIRLPSGELDAMKLQNEHVARSVRGLARAAVEKAQLARENGKSEKADGWIRTVDAMGKALTQERYNALLQLVGPAIIKTAARAQTDP